MVLRRTGTKGEPTPDPGERAALAEAERLEKVGGKNRPTPKRSSAEAARRRPLVPTDRKAAARAARDASREQRARARAGMLAGDERYLPARDRGPVRRFVRDTVDARHNIGENLILIALVILLLQFLVPVFLRSNPGASQVALLGGTALLYSTLLLIIGDSFLLRRRIRRGVAERLGEEAVGEKGQTVNGKNPARQQRRGRMPAPGVARGQPPR